MRRLVFTLAALLLALGSRDASAQAEQQSLVDRSTLAIQEILDLGDLTSDAKELLGRARAAMICPRVFRAGFILGGTGGDCVLMARDGSGSWSSPAFYTMGGGSIGLQIGVQDAQVLTLIMNDRALNAVLDSQFRFGAEAGWRSARWARHLGARPPRRWGGHRDHRPCPRAVRRRLAGRRHPVRAQRVEPALFRPRGLGRQIVVGMEAHKSGSDPLRAALMRASTGTGPAAAPPGQAPAPPARRRSRVRPRPRR